MASTWPKGQYRLMQKAYMPPAPGEFDEVCEEGRTVVYAGKPGPHMAPIDDAARKAVAMADEERARKTMAPGGEVVRHAIAPTRENERPAAATNRQADPDPNTVDIPSDWKARSWPWRKSLAAKFTSDPVNTSADAEAAIEAEIDRRIAADGAGADDEI